MVRLSASRIKSAQECSWRYWTNYHLKLPDPGNSGSSRGTCVHQVLECLIRPDRRAYSERIVTTQDAFSVPSVARLIFIHAKLNDVYDDENLELINQFIITALSADFYAEGALKVTAEVEFQEKNDRFWVLGYIDKIAEYAEHVLLVDYKTQKNYFSEEDLRFNIQALIYMMVARTKFPGKKIVFEFHQLKEALEGRGKSKVRRDIIQTVPEPSEEMIEGFREWLADYSEYLSDYDLTKAKSNYAKSDYVKSRYMCGGVLGQRRKKDMALMWVCPQKYPYTYFALYDEEGKLIKTAFNKQELSDIVQENQTIKQQNYAGCPAWKYLWETD